MKKLKKEQQEVIDKLITIFTENNEKVYETDCSVIDKLFNEVNKAHQEYQDLVVDLESSNKSIASQFDDTVESVYTRLCIMFDPYDFVSINLVRYNNAASIVLKTTKYEFSLYTRIIWNYIRFSDLYPTKHVKYEGFYYEIDGRKIDITNFDNEEIFLKECIKLLASHLSI
jgi:hypothetical protein